MSRRARIATTRSNVVTAVASLLAVFFLLLLVGMRSALRVSGSTPRTVWQRGTPIMGARDPDIVRAKSIIDAANVRRPRPKAN